MNARSGPFLSVSVPSGRVPPGTPETMALPRPILWREDQFLFVGMVTIAVVALFRAINSPRPLVDFTWRAGRFVLPARPN
ncbi:unnamed protein product [Protopolystoma xenopodis]|uniref:Uncharacterized protein n=1 Tax=Protopolystoma xenopodis TaxID=117903 RepID=A0A448WXT5_9PLAT|nr:unnamed protein product [Protopolystoma xenopodis]